MTKISLTKSFIIFIFALLMLRIKIDYFANAETTNYKFDFGDGDKQEGKDATTELYIKDKLHPNSQGADELARIVAEELHSQGLDGF